MRRIIDILAAAGSIVLFAPLVVLGWLGLKIQGVQPLCLRGEGDSDSPSGLRRFNARGDDPFSRFLRNTSIDHLPIVFDVLAGTVRFKDTVRYFTPRTEACRRPFTKREQLARGLILILATAILSALAYFFWHPVP